jgi:hypothetical protein
MDIQRNHLVKSRPTRSLLRLLRESLISVGVVVLVASAGISCLLKLSGFAVNGSNPAAIIVGLIHSYRMIGGYFLYLLIMFSAIEAMNERH